MAKSELVDEIREDFLKEFQDMPVTAVDAFSAFITQWLEKKGVVGMGFQASGLALRLSDGREVSLISQDQQPTTADTPAVGINAPQKIDPRAILGDAPSVGITG